MNKKGRKEMYKYIDSFFTKNSLEVDKSVTACLTGHRPSKLPWRYNEFESRCKKFREDLRQIFIGAYDYGIRNFLTGMAEGFDMIGAEVLLSLRDDDGLDIKVYAVVPCKYQEVKWLPRNQQRYWDILNRVDDAALLTSDYTPSCMNDRNKYMVDHSSVCIACYDGSSGGTANTIRFAKKAGCKIKIIDIKEYE